MTEYAAGPRKRRPTHPGEVVADVLQTFRVSARTAAKAIHVSPMALSNIIGAKSGVTPEMALRLGKLFGNGPEIWLGLQQDYDLWRARQAMKAELAGIKPFEPAA